MLMRPQAQKAMQSYVIFPKEKNFYHKNNLFFQNCYLNFAFCNLRISKISFLPTKRHVKFSFSDKIGYYSFSTIFVEYQLKKRLSHEE